jgi:hypothetical protein
LFYGRINRTFLRTQSFPNYNLWIDLIEDRLKTQKVIQMPNFTSSLISNYKVVLYGERGTSVIGAFIHCYHNNVNVMSCVFYNDENNVPANSKGPRVNLSYPMSKFSYVVDVLRNEKPMYFGFIESTKVGYVATYKEPVGEEEEG